MQYRLVRIMGGLYEAYNCVTDEEIQAEVNRYKESGTDEALEDFAFPEITHTMGLCEVDLKGITEFN